MFIKVLEKKSKFVYNQTNRSSTLTESLSSSEMVVGCYNSCGGINIKKIILVNNSTQENDLSYFHGNIFNIHFDGSDM